MNGWLRLWVFVSLIWCIAVSAMATIVYKEIRDEPYASSVSNKISKEAKEFYSDLEDDEDGPKYMLTLSYSDGTELEFRLPLLEEPVEEKEFKSKILNIVDEDNATISKHELDRFYKAVLKRNKLALEAKEEYDQVYLDLELVLKQEKLNFIYVTLAIASVPVLLLIILGYSIAWVRAGFNSNA